MVSVIFIIIFVITLISLVVSIPLNGYLSARLIHHAAYDSRYKNEHEEYSLFDYFDPFGTLCFFFFGFGWGLVIPIDQEKISGTARGLRIFLAYSIQALVSLVIAMAAIIPSVLLTGKECIYPALHMFFETRLHTATTDMGRHIFQQYSLQFAHCSTYAVTATLFLIGIVYVQTIMLCVSMFRNAFQAVIYPYRLNLMLHQYGFAITMALSLVSCLIFGNIFFRMALYCICLLIELFSYLKGI